MSNSQSPDSDMPRRGRTRESLAWFAWAMVSMGLASAIPAWGQQWPTQPVRVVVPFAAGGGTDVLARMLGGKFSESTGQSFLIDNRVGAGGNIGSAAVARAAPDGNMLLLTTTTLAINASLSKTISFDPVKELQPISQLMSSPLVLCMPPAVPAKTAADLVALAKTRKGGLNAASASMGSTSHISIEMMKQLTGAELVHVPYNGSGPATTAVLSGAVDLFFATAIVGKPQMDSGKFRCVAVTTARRSATFPELPPLAAQYPGFEMDLWYALFASAGTPRERVGRMNAEVAKALKAPAIHAAIVKEGGEPAPTTPEEMAAIFRKDVEKYARVVKTADIRMD